MDDVARSGLPVVLAVRGDATAALLDSADFYISADDDAAVLGPVFAAATAPAAQFSVRELSVGTARTINTLSAEAGRIGDV